MKVDQRPLEPRQVALVEGEAAAGHLRRALEVEQPQLLAELEVLLGREGKVAASRPRSGPPRCPSSEAPTGTDASGTLGRVRRTAWSRSSTASSRFSFSLISWLRARRSPRSALERRGILLRRALHLLVGGVALCLQRLERDVEAAPLRHQRAEGTEVEVAAARGEALHDRVEVLSQLLEVQHDGRASSMASPGRRYLDR